MNLVALGLLTSGAALASRSWCPVSRGIGGAMVAAAALLSGAPALADQTLVAADNSEVQCQISSKDLTRISLKDDRFASVSKLTIGVEAEDFTVVHEPTRGDLYISVPAGFTRPTISFFGTTAKGFVYKFACKVGGSDALQVFIANQDMIGDAPGDQAQRGSIADSSILLVQAMYALDPLDGYELRSLDLTPVAVGELSVRMVAEYRGTELLGRVLRIENQGRVDVTLDETVIAPRNAVAVSVAAPVLKPGAITTAYIVLPSGVLP